MAGAQAAMVAVRRNLAAAGRNDWPIRIIRSSIEPPTACLPIISINRVLMDVW